MKFVKTSLAGAFLIDSVSHEDERGSFTRAHCAKEFSEHGLPAQFVQSNISRNRLAGTFRGLHYQIPPSHEGKLVRCIDGGIADVIVDIRPGSSSFLRHEWFQLTADRPRALFVPPGFAHGFLTLSAGATVLYEMTDFYAAELSRGLRWSDPALAITLPGEISVIAPRDAHYDDLDIEGLQCFAAGPTG